MCSLNPDSETMPPVGVDRAHSPVFSNINTTTYGKYWDFLAKMGLIIENLQNFSYISNLFWPKFLDLWKLEQNRSSDFCSIPSSTQQHANRRIFFKHFLRSMDRKRIFPLRTQRKVKQPCSKINYTKLSQFFFFFYSCTLPWVDATRVTVQHLFPPLSSCKKK